MKKFFKHWVYIPIRRLYDNIIISIELNHLIYLLKKRGLNNTQINYKIREVLYLLELKDYDGSIMIQWESLFGEPFDQFDNEKPLNSG